VLKKLRACFKNELDNTEGEKKPKKLECTP
jgi:hypothetical protein